MEGMYPLAILSGGLGMRLQPLTDQVPKALVDVNGEPFIAHQLRLLRAKGIDRVVICAGHLGEMIQEFVGDGSSFGLKIDFSFDGPHLLGTAGAIKKALPLLGSEFFVLCGDTYLPCDYRAVQAEFQKSGKLGLMTVFRNEDRWDRSNVEFAAGRILVYDKRNRTPRMHHIDYGLGVFKSSVFDRIPPGAPYDLGVVYRDLLTTGQLAALEVKERFHEVGSLEGLQEIRRYLEGRIADRRRQA